MKRRIFKRTGFLRRSYQDLLLNTTKKVEGSFSPYLIKILPPLSNFPCSELKALFLFIKPLTKYYKGLQLTQNLNNLYVIFFLCLFKPRSLNFFRILYTMVFQSTIIKLIYFNNFYLYKIISILSINWRAIYINALLSLL